MVVFVRSPLGILVSFLATIAIAAFIYFVIVKPETDRANSQVDKALKQSQPLIDNANQAAKDAQDSAAQAQKDAQPQIDRAHRIQVCISKAGGDPQKIAACSQ
jgi:type II secretory pathway component PulM